MRGARRAVALEVGVLMSSPSETTLIVLTAAPGSEAASKLELVRVLGIQTV